MAPLRHSEKTKIERRWIGRRVDTSCRRLGEESVTGIQNSGRARWALTYFREKSQEGAIPPIEPIPLFQRQTPWGEPSKRSPEEGIRDAKSGNIVCCSDNTNSRNRRHCCTATIVTVEEWSHCFTATILTAKGYGLPCCWLTESLECTWTWPAAEMPGFSEWQVWDPSTYKELSPGTSSLAVFLRLPELVPYLGGSADDMHRRPTLESGGATSTTRG